MSVDEGQKNDLRNIDTVQFLTFFEGQIHDYVVFFASCVTF